MRTRAGVRDPGYRPLPNDEPTGEIDATIVWSRDTCLLCYFGRAFWLTNANHHFVCFFRIPVPARIQVSPTPLSARDHRIDRHPDHARIAFARLHFHSA